MEEKTGLEDFLSLVEAGKVSQPDITSYVACATNNYQLDELKALLHEVRTYISSRKKNLESTVIGRVPAERELRDTQAKIPSLRSIQIPKGANIILPITSEKTALNIETIIESASTRALLPLYKLEREIVVRLGETSQSSLSHSKKKDSLDGDFTLYHYLTEEGKQLFPVIKRLYSGVRFKKEYAIMLHALNELNYLSDKHFVGQEQLHKALVSTFGKVGSRQNLVKYLNDYSRPSLSERQEINRHKQRLLDSINDISH